MATTQKDVALDQAVADSIPEGGHEDPVALATIDETSVEIVPNAYSTEVAFDSTDLWISKLRLAQGMTPEVQASSAKVGQWVLTGMEAESNPIIVPVAYAKLNRRFGIVKGQRYIACNRHIGAATDECTNCRVQFQQELKDAIASGVGFESLVEIYYSYIVYVPAIEMPATLEFARTGMQAGKLLNTFAMAKGGLGRFAIKLGSSSVQGPKGNYWVPTVQLTTVAPEVLARAQDFVPRA